MRPSVSLKLREQHTLISFLKSYIYWSNSQSTSQLTKSWASTYTTNWTLSILNRSCWGSVNLSCFTVIWTISFIQWAECCFHTWNQSIDKPEFVFKRTLNQKYTNSSWMYNSLTFTCTAGQCWELWKPGYSWVYSNCSSQECASSEIPRWGSQSVLSEKACLSTVSWSSLSWNLRRVQVCDCITFKDWCWEDSGCVRGRLFYCSSFKWIISIITWEDQ